MKNKYKEKEGRKHRKMSKIERKKARQKIKNKK